MTLITSWGRGICSTKPDNDYFNLVKKSLEDKYGEVVAYPYNFAPWERLSNREKAYDLIDSYLSPDLDLVTIQLGENATVNITLRRSRLSGVARATIPDKQSHHITNYCAMF